MLILNVAARLQLFDFSLLNWPITEYRHIGSIAELFNSRDAQL